MKEPHFDFKLLFEISTLTNLITFLTSWLFQRLRILKLFKLTGVSLKQSLINFVDALSNKSSEKLYIIAVNIEQILIIVLHSIASLIQSSKTAVHTTFPA